MDEVIRPESFLGKRLCTLDEYATWMSSQAREELITFLGITEVSEIEKEKSMGSIFEARVAKELGHEAEGIDRQIGIGTQVRDAASKEYLGKVVQVETVVYV